jgi:hypothetical protein
MLSTIFFRSERFWGALSSGPLPSTGITRLARYYGPVRHPQWPSLAVTGNLLEIPVSTTEDFPCCVRSSSFVHATANTPARLPGARFARFPGSVSLPRIDWQVGPCITLFEACSAFTHVAACTLAKSLYDPLHRRLQPLRYLHDCSDCYRLERKSPGGIRTHWKSAALARRTSNSGDHGADQSHHPLACRSRRRHQHHDDGREQCPPPAAAPSAVLNTAAPATPLLVGSGTMTPRCKKTAKGVCLGRSGE